VRQGGPKRRVRATAGDASEGVVFGYLFKWLGRFCQERMRAGLLNVKVLSAVPMYGISRSAPAITVGAVGMLSVAVPHSTCALERDLFVLNREQDSRNV
jgi:hypothetical protein